MLRASDRSGRAGTRSKWKSEGGGKPIISITSSSVVGKSAWAGDRTITHPNWRQTRLFLTTPPSETALILNKSHLTLSLGCLAKCMVIISLMLFAWNQPKSKSRHFLTLILSCMCQSYFIVGILLPLVINIFRDFAINSIPAEQN